MFLPKGEVTLLNESRIGEHDFTKGAGGLGGVYAAFEAFAHQSRQQPRVVDVGVGEHDHVEICGIESELAVAVVAVVTALVKAAIEEDGRCIGACQQKLGARDGAGGAFEVYFQYSGV